MASTLRDDLASLKIERRDSMRDYRGRGGRRRGRGLFSAVLWLIPLGLLGGAGGYAYMQYDRIRPHAQVAIGLVQAMTTGEAEKLLSAKGYLVARRQATIAAKVPGLVERMDVEEGTRVKQGDVMAVIQHEDIKAQLASKLAMVQRTEAELLEAQVNLRDRQRRANRELQLQAKNHATQEAVEQTRAEAEMAAANVAALEAGLKQMKASVQETEELMRNMFIIAPFAGTVVAKDAELGETIGMGIAGVGGSFVRSAVVTLADLDHLDVETDINESLLGRVKLEQPAEVAVSAVPDKRYRGRLRQILPLGDRTRGTVKVKVEILDPDARLFPELVATVHFLPDKTLNKGEASRVSVYVPKAAIFEQNGFSHVWLVNDKNQIHQQRVEVIVTNEDLARVESGLKGGESVVLGPKPTMREGEIVQRAE